MIFIGITGGIGSGKSFVCSSFEKKKIPVFHADEIARKISDRPEVKNEIVQSFSDSILTADNNIDRKKLASIVFLEHDKLQRLNSILHPKVFVEFNHWKKSLPNITHYAIAEAALMFESGMDEQLDYILSVIADDDTRIKRVMDRDHVNRESVHSRMQHQLPSQELIERSDFVLYNNATVEDIQKQITFFHTLFSALSQRKEIE